MTTEERLEKLEKELAELRECVQTRQLLILDENGQMRAALCVSEDGPGLTLHDENGDLRAVVGVIDEGPGLTLFDDQGEPRAVLGVSKDHVRLSLQDEDGEARVVVGVSMEGPSLRLFDEKGRPLTTEQEAEVKELHNRIVDLENKLNEYVLREEELRRLAAQKAAHAKIKKRVKKSTRITANPSSPGYGSRNRFVTKAMSDAAGERIRAKLARLDTGVDTKEEAGEDLNLFPDDGTIVND